MRFLRRETRQTLLAAGAGWGAYATLVMFDVPTTWRAVCSAALLALLVTVILSEPKPEPIRKLSAPGLFPEPPGIHGFPVVQSEHTPPGQFIMVNPETWRQVAEEFRVPSPLDFGPKPNYNHMPGCKKRRDPFAACICGERGAIIARCRNEWHSDEGGGIECGKDITEPGHSCTQSLFVHGTHCQCLCGATRLREVPT